MLYLCTIIHFSHVAILVTENLQDKPQNCQINDIVPTSENHAHLFQHNVNGTE